MTMKILKVASAAAALFCLMPANDASAQCSGQFAPGYFCGNNTNSTALPKAVSVAPSLTATNHSVLVGTGAFGFASTPDTISANGTLTLNVPSNTGLFITDTIVTGVLSPNTLLTHSFTLGTASNHPLAFYTANAIAGYFGTDQRLNLNVGLSVNTPSDTLTQGLAVTQIGSQTGSQSGAFWYNYINITDDRLAITPPQQATVGLLLGLTTGGANSQGFKYGIESVINHTTATDKMPGGDEIAGLFYIRSNVSSGGTGPGDVKGSFFGMSSVASLENGSMYNDIVSAGEIDTAIFTGASANKRIVFSLVDFGERQADSVYDAAIEMYAAGTTPLGPPSPGFKTAILFSRRGGAPAVGATGTLIGTDGASATVGTGISFSSYAITGNFLAGPSNNFTVAGSGATTITVGAGIGPLNINATIDHGVTVSDGTVIGNISPNSLLTHSFAVGAVSNHPLAFYTNGTLAGYFDTSQILNLSLGSLAVHGTSSGVISVNAQAAAGTYNFNLPITAGTAGQFLTSQGGGSTAMTWTSGATGTVTSVGTTGPITGGPITTTGTIGCSSCVITSSPAMTINQLVIGQGLQGVAPLGTLGTTTTVLHGGGAAPTFGAVALGADVSGTLPAANGGTGVANNAANTLTWSGAFGATFTLTNTTTVTFPTTGTLATTAGANIPTIAQGDLLYGSAANVLSALAKNTTATRYLSNTGTTNSPAWAQIDLTNGVTNALAIGNGGTGQTTKTAAFDALSPMSAAGDIIYGGTSGTGTRLAASTSGTVLHSGTTPSWSAVSLTADVSGILPGANGGSGVANTGTTLTRAGNITFAGAFATTITATNTTNSILPEGFHTLAGLDVAQTWPATQTFAGIAATSESINAVAGAVTALIIKAGGNLSSDAPAIDFTNLAGTPVTRIYSDAAGGTTRIKAFGSLFLHAGDTGFTATNPYLQIATTGAITMPSLGSDTAQTDSTLCITSAGLLLKGTGTLGVCLGTSGRQFKSDFVQMQAGLSEVMQINLQNYRYLPGYGDGGARVQYGTTAQDIEAILPDLAGHDKNGETINYDAGALLFIGLHAIQQLKADNDNLRSELIELKRNTR